MDDTAQKQNQTDDNNQSQAQPQPRVVNQGTVQSPTVPAGSLNKEVEMAPVSDFIKPTEAPVVKDKEVAEAGVSEVSQSVELSKEHEQIGIKPAAETMPVKVEPSEKIQLPLDQAQAQKVIKTNKKTGYSIVWLAILMLKHFKKIHRKLLGKII
jgi:hypothetical protein